MGAGQCRRVLAPGGVLIVNVPTWAGKRLLELSAFRLGLSPASRWTTTSMYYGRRDLWPLLVRAGFRPEPHPPALPQARAQPLRQGDRLLSRASGRR